MIQLSADLNEPLLEWLRNGETPVDAVEVGPWFSVERTRDYQRALPELPFYFHGGDLIMKVGWIPGAVGDIAAYVRESARPWASLHIRMWLPGMVWLMQSYGWRMPLPNR